MKLFYNEQLAWSKCGKYDSAQWFISFKYNNHIPQLLSDQQYWSIPQAVDDTKNGISKYDQRWK